MSSDLAGAREGAVGEMDDAATGLAVWITFGPGGGGGGSTDLGAAGRALGRGGRGCVDIEETGTLTAGLLCVAVESVGGCGALACGSMMTESLAKT